jgi:hypothetical protein
MKQLKVLGINQLHMRQLFVLDAIFLSAATNETFHCRVPWCRIGTELLMHCITTTTTTITIIIINNDSSNSYM